MPAGPVLAAAARQQQPAGSSKALRVFTRVAAGTVLVILGIHLNQHQERQVRSRVVIAGGAA